MGIKLHRIMEAIENGATTFEEISHITGIGKGDCDGKRCRLKVKSLLQQDKLNLSERNMNTEPTIIRIVTGAYQVNTYIVFCPETREGVILR